MAKKRNMMFGRNTSTPPTPLITPSVSIDRSTGSEVSGHFDLMKSFRKPKDSSMASISGWAQVNVNQKVSRMIRKNSGRPRYLLVITMSILSEISRRRSCVMVIVSRQAPASIA